MKSLLLLRHAKSSWDDPHMGDHDRPLRRRGISAAKRMGRWMLAESRVPERVLCSSAVRVQETWQLVRRTWEQAGATIPTATTHAELYECPSSQVRHTVADLGGTWQRVLVIGHNPSLPDLLAELTGCSEAFPTAALAQVDLPIDTWSDIRQPVVRGVLVGLWRPRELDE